MIIDSAPYDSPMTGKLKAFTITYSQLASLKKACDKGRKLSYALYFHRGKPVWHKIAKSQLVNAARHQRETSLTWRQKGSGLCNKTAITYNQHVAAHPLVKTSAEKNGSTLPGRAKGKLNTYLSISYSLIYLPSIPAYHPLPCTSLPYLFSLPSFITC